MSLLSKLKAKLLIWGRPLVRYFKPAPLHLLRPVSRRFGYERGTPVARWFIDRFIERNRTDIKGVVLEVKNRKYTTAMGAEVSVSDVLDIDTTNTIANIHADLTCCEGIPSDRYDCFVLTETLQYVFDASEALRQAHRILKPNGVLLASVPSVSPQDTEQGVIDCWRFAPRGCRQLFSGVFGDKNVQMEPYGNFATSVAGLAGIAVEELPREELEKYDSMFTHGICIRAQKLA